MFLGTPQIYGLGYRLFSRQFCKLNSYALIFEILYSVEFQMLTYCDSGDITKSSHADHVVAQARPNVIFNTASPHAYGEFS